jgi:DNA-binding HxlR family transcriptional regulator
MYRKNLTAIDCSTARALDQVGEWWSLMIVRECTLGTTRFDEFQRRLGIARNILTNRLAHLAEQGIISKVPVGESERFFLYQLTPKGEALYPVLVALMQWGDRWTGTGEGGPIKLVDNQTGEPVQYMNPRSADGADLGFRDIRLEPNPCAGERTREIIAGRNRAILGDEEAALADADDKTEQAPR